MIDLFIDLLTHFAGGAVDGRKARVGFLDGDVSAILRMLVEVQWFGSL